MKYAIIIAGGGGEPAGEPVPDLDGFTPLEAAQTPTLDALGQVGRQGVAAPGPAGSFPGAHEPIATLLGVDASGWAPSSGALGALGLGVEIGPSDAAWSLTPVTLDADFAAVADPFPANLTPAETRALTESLGAALAGRPDLGPLRVAPGTGPLGTGAVLILEDAPEEARSGRAAMPGADALAGRALIRAFPKGELGQRLRAVCELSAEVFQSQPVNTLRAEQGLSPVSMFWASGGGGLPVDPGSFADGFGVRAALITGDAGAAGVAALLGIDRLPVPGELAGVGADFRSMASHAIEALDRYDLAIVHTEALTGVSLAGDWRAKAALWERIDEELIRPVHARLLAEGDAEAEAGANGWRLLVSSGSVCSSALRMRTGEAAPFVMAGAFIRSVLRAPFGDTSARESDLKINPGHTLMEYFLYSGLRVPRRRSGVALETHQREV